MENIIPKLPDGTFMARFEVKEKNGERAIFINDELFDWSVDKESLNRARNMGPEYLKMAQLDIEKHFLESLSEFLNREITKEDVAMASRIGWI